MRISFMKKQNQAFAYFLIGLGLYFLSQQFNIPYLPALALWPSVLVIFGLSLLLDRSKARNDDKPSLGAFLLLLGLHLHFINHLSFWVDHWSMYLILIGLSLLIGYQKTKRGLKLGVTLFIVGLFFLLSLTYLPFQEQIQSFIQNIESYWPIGLILFGSYLLFKK
ncbi:hypothetical protein DES38_10856 [Streptohalobacillus salinus]|uniref:LiaF transmembrane domain-containing protein n=1 Tax=Streptohalobacillus salinus TaxID=621096 RepID=A0A2V3WA76_9BACI|nr:DUF5668 domain-containing protein [Streptohalobacillus salinus]PXW90044.1 hypothetical protein DES38_10856 [Streptohalobacillus salinus]